MTPDSPESYVEQALRAAKSGSAGHWPTVAAVLHDEVLRLRAELAETVPAAQSATVDDTALIERAAIALARGDTGEAKWWSDDAHRAHEQVYGPLLAAKAAEIDRWRQLYGDLANLVEQRIAELFPDLFPRFPGDSGTDDRCVGDQVPESLLAMVCTEVNRLRKVDAELAAKVPTAQPATVDYNALRELYVAAVRRGAGLAEELKRARVELAAKDAEIERVTRQRDQFSAYYLDEAKSHDETLGAVWRLRSELTSARARQDVVPADAVGQIAARVHDVLCDCHGNHTGMTIRSTDFDKIRAGVRPLIESWRPATEPDVMAIVAPIVAERDRLAAELVRAAQKRAATPKVVAEQIEEVTAFVFDETQPDFWSDLDDDARANWLRVFSSAFRRAGIPVDGENRG